MLYGQKLYQYPICKDILQIPIPRTDGIVDKRLWKHSNSGEYKFYKAYSLIQQTQSHTNRIN